MVSEQDLLKLIGLVYDAAGDPSLWPRFLERLGRVLGTMTNNLVVQEVPIRAESYKAALGMTGMAPDYYRAYLAYYHARNPYLIAGGRISAEGAVCSSDDLYPRDLALRSEFYNDWIVPQGMEDALYGVILNRSNVVSLINVVRPKNAPPFCDEEAGVLEALLPHLRRAVELHLRITRLQRRADATTDALDRLPTAVLLLDERGRLVFANKAAEAILAARDGLVAEATGLRAATGAETAVLRKLVRDAIATSKAKGLAPGGALALERPSGKRPLGLLVTPLHSTPLLAEPQIAAMALVSDPEAADETNEAGLARVYGLSRAEAAVAALVSQGLGLPEACDRLHVSRNTAKTHLQNIFEKTGTRRQSELVRLVLKTPAIAHAAG